MKKLSLVLTLALPLLAQNPFQRDLYCEDAGSTDTYVCSFTVVPSAYATGTTYKFKANTANTGAATVNFNSLGAKTIVKVAGGITTTLDDNDIRAGQEVILVYDGTNMQMQSMLGNAAGTVTEYRYIQMSAVNGGSASPVTNIVSGGVSYSLGNTFYRGGMQMPNTGTPTLNWSTIVPANWTGDIDVKLYAGDQCCGSGNLKLDVSTACVHEGELNHNADPSFNTASTVTNAAGTFPQLFSYTAVDATGCAAGDRLILKIIRDNGVGSNIAGNTAIDYGMLIIRHN